MADHAGWYQDEHGNWVAEQEWVASDGAGGWVEESAPQQYAHHEYEYAHANAPPERLTPEQLAVSIVESTKLAAQQELTVNYGTLASEWRRSFQNSCTGIRATMADPKDPRTVQLPPCIFCREALCETAFFPCGHVCVCEACIDSHQFTDESTARRMVGAKAAAAVAAGQAPPGGAPLPAFTMCPCCMTSIKRMVSWSPDAANKYWEWVDGPVPKLGGDFHDSWSQNAKFRRRPDGKAIAPPPLRLDKDGKPLPARPAPSPFQHGAGGDELGGCCVVC